MPYLPVECLNDTTFPSAGGDEGGGAGNCPADLDTTLGLISELWTTTYSRINYHTLLYTPTFAKRSNDMLSGIGDQTLVDDLWGEDINVDADLTKETVVQEPVVDELGNPELDSDGNPVTEPVVVTEGISFEEVTGVKWTNPHDNPNIDAYPSRKYNPPVPVHAAILTQVRTRTLKRLGIDDFKGLLVTIPTILMDRAGLQARTGDIFEYDCGWWEVVQYYVNTNFYNTNIKLYVQLHCQRLRWGA